MYAFLRAWASIHQHCFNAGSTSLECSLQNTAMAYRRPAKWIKKTSDGVFCYKQITPQGHFKVKQSHLRVKMLILSLSYRTRNMRCNDRTNIFKIYLDLHKTRASLPRHPRVDPANVCGWRVFCKTNFVQIKFIIPKCKSAENRLLNISSYQFNILSCQINIWSCQLDILSYELDILSSQLDIMSCELNISSFKLIV